jgi:hypothetical protein
MSLPVSAPRCSDGWLDQTDVVSGCQAARTFMLPSGPAVVPLG